MSVTTKREVSFEVSHEGGFPTRDEFAGVITALADVVECGVERLFHRINAPIVEAYEAGEEVRLSHTYEDIGVLSVSGVDLEYYASDLTEKLARLRGLVEDLGDSLKEGGRVMTSPKYNLYGTDEYMPTVDALERWGLRTPKSVDA